MEALRQQIAALRQSFFDEEILDQYFLQLEELEACCSPDFVEDVATVYFRESTRTLATIEKEMEKTTVNYVLLHRCFYRMKGSSASIGANKVRNEVNKTRQYCSERNLEAAKASFEQLKVEHSTLKAKLMAYFEEILDQYFVQLEELEACCNPDFVEDEATVYFRESTRTLATVEKEMEKTTVNYVLLDRCFYRLKGSSASIGANKVRNEVNETRQYCSERNLEAAKASFEQLKVEPSTLKAKLMAYFELVAQLGTE